MTEICDFWHAVWHDAWASWDGLWLFQVSARPLDRAMGLTSERRPDGAAPAFPLLVEAVVR